MFLCSGDSITSQTSLSFDVDCYTLLYRFIGLDKEQLYFGEGKRELLETGSTALFLIALSTYYTIQY